MDNVNIYALRNLSTDTDDNKNAIIDIISDKNCKKITFFASLVMPHNMSGVGNANCPLFFALAEYSIYNFEKIYLIFDHTYLNCQRPHRYSEIKNILDAAEKMENVFYSTEKSTITTDLPASEAATHFLSHKNIKKFNTQNRKSFFSLLSSVPEEKFLGN